MMKQWTLVQVEWVDSHETSGWQFVKDIKADPNVRGMTSCISVGFVYEDGDDALTIAPTMAPHAEENEIQVMGLFAIPRVAIRKIKRVAAPLKS